MKGADHEVRVVQSVFDRLYDEAPRIPRDLLPTRAETVRALRAAVQRDLDDLLNTRNPFADLADAYPEVATSVLAYGLPDFSAMGARSSLDHGRIRQAIESAIKHFEPRLTAVTAVVVEDRAVGQAAAADAIRIRVEAKLVMDPAPEAVAFDVTMPVTSGNVEIRERE